MLATSGMMAQQETEPGAKGVVQLLAAKANANFAEKIATALVRAGYQIDDGAFDPRRIDAVVVLWTGVALDDADLIAKARDAWKARRLAPVSIGRVEAPFGAKEMTPMDLAGWRGGDDDPRWGFVLTDIEELKARARLRSQEEAPTPAPAKQAAPAEPKSEPEPVLSAVFPKTGVKKAPEPQRHQANSKPAAKLKAPPRKIPQAEQPAAVLHPARHAWRYHILPAAPAVAGVLVVLGLVAGGAYFAAGLRPSESSAPEKTAAPAEPAKDPSVQEKPDPDASLSLVRLAPGEKPPEDGGVENLAAADETPGAASAEGARDLSVTAQLREAGLESDGAPDAAGETDAAEAEETHLAALSVPRLKPAPPDGSVGDDPGSDDPDHETAPDLNQAALAELASAVEAATHTNEEETHRGDFFSDCSGCPDMAALDGGAFLMGAPRGEEGRQPAEGPQRRINIGYRFAIATRETTFDQWALCVDDGGCRKYDPSDEGWGRADRPVINVSYEDASAYARWLSAKTGSYYRLPSEAEWEFAARAGGENAAPSAMEANVDAGGAAPGETVPVTTFRHNAFGLFGMLGNVREWTLDCWAPSHNGGPATGAARIDGDCSRRVVKGGAGNAPGSAPRPAARRPEDVERRAPDTGFRVVRVLD